MTTIRLNNDYDRGNFQIKMALMYLASEVKSGMIMCHPSKGTTVRTLARYFPGLKKTRKGAYKQLVDVGVYKQLDDLKKGVNSNGNHAQ
jgi:hypothetical protein